MEIQQATIVKILPTAIWIESDIMGGRSVMLQHQGCEPFEYARFGYDYRYTSNSGTIEAAKQLAIQLGATEPIEHRSRPMPLIPTADEVRDQIKELTEFLADIEAADPPAQPAQEGDK
jgi:hypothetical protein